MWIIWERFSSVSVFMMICPTILKIKCHLTTDFTTTPIGKSIFKKCLLIFYQNPIKTKRIQKATSINDDIVYTKYHKKRECIFIHLVGQPFRISKHVGIYGNINKKLIRVDSKDWRRYKKIEFEIEMINKNENLFPC